VLNVTGNGEGHELVINECDKLCSQRGCGLRRDRKLCRCDWQNLDVSIRYNFILARHLPENGKIRLAVAAVGDPQRIATARASKRVIPWRMQGPEG
jgi:hypothetical protein